MSAGVTERTREMGLRGALGASPTSIVRLVIARGLALTVAGSILGAMGVAAAQGLLRQFVFGVTPGDPITLVSVAALLSVVALVSCAVPAWRAVHIDPAITLRE
jgi:ABC-type antimicrobial peptide transport system permease subunit